MKLRPLSSEKGTFFLTKSFLRWYTVYKSSAKIGKSNSEQTKQRVGAIG